MAVFKCKMCGGTLEIDGNISVAVCEYCGTKQTLPKLDDEKRTNLYDRANHLRRNNEFDKAMGIYEQILNEDTTDSEAYWSLVLCKYGIEYVDDPVTHKRKPTMNRTQFTSILADENYKAALQYADSYQKEVYEEEATEIDRIQKGILEISQKEEPFDVFICYKETDNSGRRTQDSVLANDLYHQLTQEGFKVFFARITLEDKLGSAYEPYIFAALNSAKVMVVLGTKPEYFNSVWVKNEWSRFLGLIQKNSKKTLIPAYRDMDPYDLPEEFSHLQAQDMSKLGFMQDLIRGIKKLTVVEEPKVIEKQVIITSTGESAAGTASLLKRAFLFLEDGDWTSADDYCEKVLDIDPECAKAYIGKMLATLNLNREIDLIDYEDVNVLTNHPHYQKACRFADENYRVVLEGYIADNLNRKELQRKEKIYQEATDCMVGALKSKKKNDYEVFLRIAEQFEQILDYKDATEKREECLERWKTKKYEVIYQEATSLISNLSEEDSPEYKREIYINAAELYGDILEYNDSEEKRELCIHRVELLETEIAQQKLKQQKEDEAKLRKIKKFTICLIIIACISIVVTLLYQSFMTPMLQYNSAKELLEENNYLEAYEMFMELEDYKDSAQLAETAYTGVFQDISLMLYKGEYASLADCYDTFSKYSSDSKQIEMQQWSRYYNAKQLIEDKKYEEASRIFTELGAFQDSKNMAIEAEAQMHISAGNYFSAITLYTTLGNKTKTNRIINEGVEYYVNKDEYENAIQCYQKLGSGYETTICELACKAAEKYLADGKYANAESILAQVEYDKVIKNAYTKNYYKLLDECAAWKLPSATEGSIVTFGSYDQKSNLNPEPISWILVEKSDNKVLLVSEYALELYAYNDKAGYCTWADSSLRKFLNGSFFNSAFKYVDCIAETVIGGTKDKVFILNADEMTEKLSKYGACETKPTDLVRYNMGREDYYYKFEGNYMLWTRDIVLDNEETNVLYVGENGYVSQVGMDSQNQDLLIRPAIWISLE